MQKIESQSDVQYDVKIKENFEKSQIYYVIKRIIDILGSFFGIIILSPLMIIIAVLIKIGSPGPVIFSQDRIGQNGKRFNDFLECTFIYRVFIKGDKYAKIEIRKIFA